VHQRYKLAYLRVCSKIGNGADTDIIIASAKAYLNALNRLHLPEERINPQGGV